MFRYQQRVGLLEADVTNSKWTHLRVSPWNSVSATECTSKALVIKKNVQYTFIR